MVIEICFVYSLQDRLDSKSVHSTAGYLLYAKITCKEKFSIS